MTTTTTWLGINRPKCRKDSDTPQTLVSETPPEGFSVRFDVLAIRGTTVAYVRTVTDPMSHQSTREVRRQDMGGQPSTVSTPGPGDFRAAALPTAARSSPTSRVTRSACTMRR